jgi:transcriptional regulator with XRE-family HTH domain
MHPVRIGRIVRTLRRRRGWRQVDLAARAGVSQQAVSLIETGRCRELSAKTLDRVLLELDAELELLVRWRGGELDKVVDAGHAALEGGFGADLVRDGWLVKLEVTYSIGRDRGSIDLFAFHRDTASLLVAEIKSDITSADGTLRRHDEKVRLGARIAHERFGWVAATVSRLLVLPEASTPRRRVRSLAPLLDRVYPTRGPAVRRWLRRPDGVLSGLLFWSDTNMVGGRRDLTSRRRVTLRRSGVSERAARRSERGRPQTQPPAAGGFVDSSVEHQDAW